MFSMHLPKAIKSAAKQAGIKVSSKVKLNPKSHLQSLSHQLKSSSAVPAFVVPPAGVSGRAAISAAAKVLNTPSARLAVSNTKALAALGDPDAQRGLVSLHAAEIALKTGARFPPPPKGTQPSTYKRVYPKSEVFKLANNTTVANGGKPKPVVAVASVSASTTPTLWTRFKRWVGKKL